MKKIICLCSLLFLCSFAGMAQQFALIDMEYIFKNIPDVEKANKELAEQSKKWQSEVEAIQTEAQNMYKAFQKEIATLSPQAKTQREEAIIKKEQEAQDLKLKYFGAEGEMFKKRQAIMSPYQDKIYEAVKEISLDEGIDVVVDRASAMSIIYANPAIDISNEVLAKLGYSK